MVEPSLSVNPLSHDQYIGVFQQDRWSDGGARGLAEVYSNDGGRHVREAPMPFSSCAPGGLNYERASDGWVSFGPDGTAYADGLNFDDQGFRNGVGAAVSHDGGRTWQHVTELIADTQAEFGDDKNAVTADPVRPGTAYAVWDRLDTGPNGKTFTGPGLLAVTRDFGRTWSPARIMVPTAQNEQTIGNLIVVDRRTGVLYDVYTDIVFTDATGNTVVSSTYKVERSTDAATWSAPSTVATDSSVADVDPNTGAALRTGAGLASVAIDPNTGALYVAYEGTDFTSGKYNQAQLVHSTDGGRTWSAPERVNGAPQAEAFTPTVAVDAFGTVAVTYYDLRDLPPGDTTTLPTTTWLTTAAGPNAKFAGERQLSGVFDLLRAANAGGFFLGDYEALDGTAPRSSPCSSARPGPADRPAAPDSPAWCRCGAGRPTSRWPLPRCTPVRSRAPGGFGGSRQLVRFPDGRRTGRTIGEPGEGHEAFACSTSSGWSNRAATVIASRLAPSRTARSPSAARAAAAKSLVWMARPGVTQM